jgi:hypothetical protein
MYLFDWSDLRGLGHRWAEAETPTTRRKQFFRSWSRHPRYLWLQYKVSSGTILPQPFHFYYLQQAAYCMLLQGWK